MDSFETLPSPKSADSEPQHLAPEGEQLMSVPELGSRGPAASYTSLAPPPMPPGPIMQNDDIASQLAAQIPAVTADELAADDIDLIEKEWIVKAKRIVADTHGDPYKQNKELNRVRAEYIKKRYNKTIKLSDD